MIQRWRLMQQGRDAVGQCTHCNTPILRIRLHKVTGNPWMWIHRAGNKPQCSREPGSPYAAPKETP